MTFLFSGASAMLMSFHTSSAVQIMAGIFGFSGAGGLVALGGIGSYIKSYRRS